LVAPSFCTRSVNKDLPLAEVRRNKFHDDEKAIEWQKENRDWRLVRSRDQLWLLQAVQEINHLAGVRCSGENRPLVVFRDFQPFVDGAGVVLANLGVICDAAEQPDNPANLIVDGLISGPLQRPGPLP
jgi:hypothetical protein